MREVWPLRYWISFSPIASSPESSRWAMPHKTAWFAARKALSHAVLKATSVSLGFVQLDLMENTLEMHSAAAPGEALLKQPQLRRKTPQDASFSLWSARRAELPRGEPPPHARFCGAGGNPGGGRSHRKAPRSGGWQSIRTGTPLTVASSPEGLS